MAEDPFREALEVSRTAGFSADEWEAYERAKMAEQDARGALAIERQEGKAEGKLEGKLEALLLLLAHRGIALMEEDRARVGACADGALLDRWFQRALTATSAAEVFA